MVPVMVHSIRTPLLLSSSLDTLNYSIEYGNEAMPSRKKAKGKARKAAQAKKEEELLAEKARELANSFRLLEQSQIQRLQLQVDNAHRSVLPICMHGFDPFPNGDICTKLTHAFVHQFHKWYRKIYKAGKNAERELIECLLEARESTQDEYSVVWNDAAKMKQVISYFLHNGAVLVLDGDEENSRHSALFARFFEQWLSCKLYKSQAYIDWPKVIETAGGDEHTVVKFIWRRIRCSCLDEKYDEVKSITKEGFCYNQHCTHPNIFVERSKLRCCSRCRSITYCSRECQIADWSVHKELCDEVAAARAEFDASRV